MLTFKCRFCGDALHPTGVERACRCGRLTVGEGWYSLATSADAPTLQQLERDKRNLLRKAEAEWKPT